MMTLGVTKFFAESFTEHQRNELAALFAFGWIIAIIGFVMDKRRSRQEKAMDHFQTYLIKKKWIIAESIRHETHNVWLKKFN